VGYAPVLPCRKLSIYNKIYGQNGVLARVISWRIFTHRPSNEAIKNKSEGWAI
jgi:hypothetical protein